MEKPQITAMPIWNVYWTQTKTLFTLNLNMLHVVFQMSQGS